MSTDGPTAASAFQRAITPRAPLFALIDAARESDGPYQAREAGVAHESLFAGDLGEMLADVAPYVVDFHRDSAFFPWWFAQWGKSIGVLVEAPVTLPDLRRHFRTLLMVRGEQRKQYYFRFYDPRVLRVFLPSCTPEELRQFFGPITAFYCESEGGGELLTFALTPNGLSVKRNPISPLSA
jgi:hypothetical protein